MSEQALSMTEAKQKLAELKKYIPKDSSDGLLYEFGRILAGYLNSELVPMGFVMGCQLALHDIQKGVNGFTGQPIRSCLVGYPPIIYAHLEMEIPRIADAVLPPDFAAEVKKFIEQVEQEMNKAKA